MTGKDPGAIMAVGCASCGDVGVIGAELADLALCFGTDDRPHDPEKMKPKSLPVALGTIWYEDDRRLELATAATNSVPQAKRFPRETGRIVKVVGVDPAKMTVVVQLVGGRHVAHKALGTLNVTKLRKFGFTLGYRPLPDEHLGEVTYVEGWTPDPS